MLEAQSSILIVDDHPDNLRTLSAILSTEGYKVRKAISGEIALNTVSSYPPDLILLDIRMPDMDGYEVCSILKANRATSEIPVIFLSALDEMPDKVKAFRVGGVDYITKPFQAEEVLVRVENQLRLTQLSRQLKQSQANLVEAQKVAHVGNWEYDVFTHTITGSDELFRIFGLEPSQIQLTLPRLLRFIHPDDRRVWEQAMRQALVTGNYQKLDFRILLKDGQVRYLEGRGELIYNNSREIKKVFGTVLDITERKHIENALRERENLYRQMFEEHQAVKLVIHPTSRSIVDANPAAARFYGYELDELRRMKITDLNVRPPDWNLEQIVKIALQDQGEFRFRHRLASGEIRDVAIYFSPITQQGEVLLYTIIHDITQRMKAEEALRESEARERKKAEELTAALEELKHTQSQLIQTEKMSSLGQMVAGIVHEINNPINFINGNLFHIKQNFQDLLDLIKVYQKNYPYPIAEIQNFKDKVDLEFILEDWLNIMHSMEAGTQRIQDVVQSLQSFSRLDQSELKFVDIHEGIDNTLILLKSRLKGIGDRPEIQIIKDYGKLPKISCYASQLNQVFLNLLNNAIDAVESQPEPRQITIHTALIESANKLTKKELDSSDRTLYPVVEDSALVNPAQPLVAPHKMPDQPCILILITDNGMGMSAEIQAKIFDPFFTTKPVGSGTGLGLSISHQIVVKKHGGQLSCLSVPGYGTAFLVELPLFVESGQPSSEG